MSIIQKKLYISTNQVHSLVDHKQACYSSTMTGSCWTVMIGMMTAGMMIAAKVKQI